MSVCDPQLHPHFSQKEISIPVEAHRSIIFVWNRFLADSFIWQNNSQICISFTGCQNQGGALNFDFAFWWGCLVQSAKPGSKQLFLGKNRG